MNKTKTLNLFCKRKKEAQKTPDSLNKPISSSPGSFQLQIKGFGGPSLVCGTFPCTGLNGPLWEKHRFRMGWHERGWTGTESETNTHWREQSSSVSPSGCLSGGDTSLRFIYHQVQDTTMKPPSRGMSLKPSLLVFYRGDLPPFFSPHTLLIGWKFGQLSPCVFMHVAVFDWCNVSTSKAE